MGIFKLIYSWFYSIYSMYLFDYLKGMDCNGFFVGPDHFITIGGRMLLVSLAIAVIYYYAINHPRFNRLWSWLIMLFSTAVINFTVGFSYVYNRLNEGQIPSCFMETEDGEQLLTNSNCILFGLTNALIGVFFFFFFSMIIKWWSRNSKYSPF